MCVKDHTGGVAGAQSDDADGSAAAALVSFRQGGGRTAGHEENRGWLLHFISYPVFLLVY